MQFSWRLIVGRSKPALVETCFFAFRGPEGSSEAGWRKTSQPASPQVEACGRDTVVRGPEGPSEAGWRKTSQPASPQVEAPGWDEPMAVNEREATCGTSCKDLGGIVPPEAKLKMWT